MDLAGRSRSDNRAGCSSSRTPWGGCRIRYGDWSGGTAALRIRALDLATGEDRRVLEGPSSTMLGAAYSPDGSHVIASRTTWGLGVFELWAYHLDGGKGVQITQAAANGEKDRSRRVNSPRNRTSPSYQS